MTLVSAIAGPSAYWYLARGTGAVSLLLLTASVILGIMGPLRAAVRRWPRFAVDALHRDISLLVMGVLVVHVITSVLDSFAPIRLVDAVIPFTSSYRPLWLGLGALSFDLLIALVITSLLRRRLGYRSWRAVHWLAYASWPVAVLHGLGTGSDTKVWWMLLLTVFCLLAVLAAVLVRIARALTVERGRQMPAVALALAAPAGIAIFTLAGPLQPGWARKAGTPASLLGSHPVAARLPPAGRASAPDTSAVATGGPFSAAVAGTIKQTPEPGGAVVDLSLRLSGGAHGRLRVRMAGAPLDGGGLSLTGSQVDLTANGLPAVLQGQILSLQGQRFLARVSGGGASLTLRADLNIDSGSGQVTGSLTASPQSGV